MSYVQRVPATVRICSRACGVALASLVAALSACGAGNSPVAPFGVTAESAAARVEFAEILRESGSAVRDEDGH